MLCLTEVKQGSGNGQSRAVCQVNCFVLFAFVPDVSCLMHGSNKRRRLFLQLGSITLVAIEALQQHRWNMVAKHDLESSKMFCIFLFYVLDKGMGYGQVRLAISRAL